MKSRFFKIEELVQPDTLELLGEDFCWDQFDHRLIENIDWLKSHFKNVPIYINNWLWGGNRKYSGHRSVSCKIGALNSKHRNWEAVDMVFSGFSADEIRLFLADHKEELPHPIRLEAGVSWVHMDVANDTDEKIIYFNA